MRGLGGPRAVVAEAGGTREGDPKPVGCEVQNLKGEEKIFESSSQALNPVSHV